MKRKLASIRKIEEVKLIQGADRICAYRIGGWWVVGGINQYKVGDLVVYFETDSFLPIKPEFEFLRKSCFKKMYDEEGFRLRIVRLKGQISNGLIMPLSVLSSSEVNEGDNVTEVLGVKLYEHPIPAELSGIAKGVIPSCVPQTDEIRIQNFANDSNISLAGQKVYVTEKLHGTSCTFFVKDGEFNVCGRNYIFEKDEKNSFWKFAEKFNLEERMREYSRSNEEFAIQGELIGEGINKNIYKIRGQTVKFFTAHSITQGRRLSKNEFKKMITDLGLETVPILEEELVVPNENICDYFIEMANGKSVLNPKADREGIVVRGLDSEFSFKAISYNFLINE